MRITSLGTTLLFAGLAGTLAACPATNEPAVDGGAATDAGPRIDTGAPPLDGALSDAGPLDAPPCLCVTDADCQDDAYCNGVEICESCACRAATVGPCAGSGSCDEATDRCSPCAAGADEDGDGSCVPADCDDIEASVHPGSTEVCNGVDDDCDGTVDDGVSTTFYVDADGDGFGDPSSSMTACAPPSGYVTNATDCDDTRAAVHPGALEVCDAAMVDEDCDGTANPATLCMCSAGTVRACAAPGVCASGVESCIAGTWSACSIAPTPEVCNGVDDDCDAAIDEGVTVACYVDADGDTYAPAGAAVMQSCPVAGRPTVGGCPVGSTNRAPTGPTVTDCNDTNPAMFPGSGC